MGRRDFENVSPAIRTMGPLNNDQWRLFNRLIGAGELVGGVDVNGVNYSRLHRRNESFAPFTGAGEAFSDTHNLK